jgi:hypothetical protein
MTIPILYQEEMIIIMSAKVKKNRKFKTLLFFPLGISQIQ